MVRGEGIRVSFERGDQGLRETARDGNGELAVPMAWAFGSGSRGVTLVGLLAKDTYLESAVSFYARTSSLDITPGQQSLKSSSLFDAVGQTNGVRKCFPCHATGPVTFGEQQVTVAEPGVWCETCHGPARQHAQAAARKDVPGARRLIRRLGGFSGERLNPVCGNCHRPPAGGEAVNDFAVAWNVRHQPPYLERSKCFGGGRLSCSTCHPAHQELRREDAAFYRERCLGCHGSRAGHSRPARTCFAQPDPDCVQCHMPAVPVSAQLAFRNHWIGVYRGDQVLIPVR